MNYSSQASVQTPTSLGCCIWIRQGMVLEQFGKGNICKLSDVLDSFRREILGYGHGTDFRLLQYGICNPCQDANLLEEIFLVTNVSFVLSLAHKIIRDINHINDINQLSLPSLSHWPNYLCRGIWETSTHIFPVWISHSHILSPSCHWTKSYIAPRPFMSA